MSAAPSGPAAVLAVIPARGGSKGVPAKNLAAVGGIPLVARAVRACRAARLVTDVVVSTDDAAIAATARGAGAVVVQRPAVIAGDTATSEAAVLHAMDAYEAMHGTRVGTVLLVQCTSPFLTGEDIDGVAAAVLEQGADSALTVAPFHGFVWREGDDFAAGEEAAAIPLARGDRPAGPEAATDVRAGAGPASGDELAVVPGPARGDQDAVPGATPGGPFAVGHGDTPSAGELAVVPGSAGSVAAPGPGEGRPAGQGDTPSPAGYAPPQAGATRPVAPARGDQGAAPGTATDARAGGRPPQVTDTRESAVARPTSPIPAAGGHGVNHDKSHRPRRQDRPQDLLETGAAYAMRADGFRRAGHRFFGRTELVRTDAARVLEVDDPHDLARARALAPLLDVPGAGALPTRDDVDAVVLDFDGTQTDDRVLIDSDGRELVAVHRGDGLGVAALRKAGLALLILSTEVNQVVAARGRKLRVPVLHGIDRKDLALKQWCEEHAVAPERVLYVGNDVNDVPCFDLVGWPVAVADAHDVVRGAARAVTSAPGGRGAVREIASWLLGPSL
ncbi:YrbI family 3-deoxy-D-manno-octulosonate 8-phosphate phosphatase [Streptomyces syringium]|uniref:N-acylneuraminate cytidylyltransferase n=1 Tax=Streptomyces syringium TaxID=76729 RepID=A0ABS4Y7I0_9ACTN|nr:NTP transferase domain-containing protein [Streptomyces syringium]MBP2404748.1 YrbI family 3-deoxy-D-manno-octulosonate 8-phosphate phosphatase [Streptomyces syringium]